MKKLLFLFILVASHVVEAKNLGKIQHSFDIGEEKFTEMIKRKSSNIDTALIQKKMTEDIRERVKNPTSLRSDFLLAKVRNRKIIDLTYVVPKDIKLHDGTIFIRKGTKVNILDYVNLNFKLYFLDEKDEKQVNWLKKQNLADNDKIILIAGSPIELSKKLSRNVYFDQLGDISTRFQVTKIPAIVSQQGKEIILEEVPV